MKASGHSLFAFAVGVLIATSGQSSADDIKAGDLIISQPWSRATPGGAKVGAGYLTIENKGTSDDTLKSGSSDVAGKVEIHEMAMSDGVMKMRPLANGLTIPAGKSVTLGPGGYHVMFMDLKQPLKQGTPFNATLEFEKAGKVTVSFPVEGVGAQSPKDAMKSMPDKKSAPDKMMNMDHSKMKM